MRREFNDVHVVRYDECNSDGLLTPATFLRYMQDIAARDAEDARLSGNGYWVVKRTIISFAAPVKIHMRLELKTFGIGFTRIKAHRGYEARSAGEQQDEPVIAARTLWAYLDMRGRPVRLPEGTASIWLPDESSPPRPEEPFPAFPAAELETTTRIVQFSDIDLVGHLNNAAAVEMLDDAAWEGYAQAGITPETASFDALHYDIEYADSPRFGERLDIQSWLDPLPPTGQECTRWQQITREGRVVVRAHSRWLRRGRHDEVS